MSNAPRTVSLTTFWLSIALAVATTAAVVLALVHFTGQPATGGSSSGGLLGAIGLGTSQPEPFVQTGTIKPEGQKSGDVIYAIPYAIPPQLTLNSAKRKYTIAKQDERGFSWMAGDTLDSLRALADGLHSKEEPKKEETPVLEEFTWEAKGIPAGADAAGLPFEQKGSFNSVNGLEGEIVFPIPYGSKPNVEISGDFDCVITEIQPTGFKWKDGGDPKASEVFRRNTVEWEAKGARPSKG